MVNRLTLIANVFFPLKYWYKAFKAIVYLINRLPTPMLGMKSPLETLKQD